MKRLILLFTALLLTASGTWTRTGLAQEGQWGAEEPAAAPYEEGPDLNADSYEESDVGEQRRALGQFEPELAPYGSWRVDTRYGRVWVPRVTVVGAGFVPYSSGGHWEMTAHDDWLWVSDYPFGWMTFHYGRWARLTPGDWGWIPGYRYSPAWVDFRVGARGYVGWGPRPPRRSWRGGAYWALSGPSHSHFVYVPSSFVFASRLHSHILRDQVRIRRLSRSSRRYRTRRAVRGRRVYSPTLRSVGVGRRHAPRRRVSLSKQRRRRSVSRSSGKRVRGASRHNASRRRGTTRAKPRHKAKSRGRSSTKASRSRRSEASKSRRSSSSNRAKPRAKPRSRSKRPAATKRRGKGSSSGRAKAKPNKRGRAKSSGRNRSRGKSKSRKSSSKKSKSSKSKSRKSKGRSSRGSRRKER